MKAKIRAIVDEVVESILEGGPGSGPQKGGGKKSDAVTRVRETAEKASRQADYVKLPGYHKIAEHAHEKAKDISKFHGDVKGEKYHTKKAKKHKNEAMRLQKIHEG
jgi:hypothetical protein